MERHELTRTGNEYISSVNRIEESRDLTIKILNSIEAGPPTKPVAEQVLATRLT